MAAEEEDEDVDAVAPESNTAVEEAENPNNKNEEGKEEEDELAEYGLDRYDEEDVGESDAEAVLFYIFLVFIPADFY